MADLGSTSKINDLVHVPNLAGHLLVIQCRNAQLATLSDRKSLIAIGLQCEPAQNENAS
jgi:hypothetical protein